MSCSWITVIGIGDDGLDGLPQSHINLINEAEVLVGGKRHHDKVRNTSAEVLDWGQGFDQIFLKLEKRRGKKIVVLASGDPMHFGVGSILVRAFGKEAITIYPALSAFSLAAARMGWSIPEVDCLTIHGRPLENLNKFIIHNARLLILSKNGSSPVEVANLLDKKGFGESKITVLEHLGGINEDKICEKAAQWKKTRCANLNTIAIKCVADGNIPMLSRVPGLPDEVYENDGQLTKREVRAITLAQLQPLSGQVLWDIGSGSGAISIEWLRLGGHRRAIAIEKKPERAEALRRNADNLGAADIKIYEGDFLSIKDEIKCQPDAIFIGGGASNLDLLKVAWSSLNPGGRIVVNVVSIEAVQALVNFRKTNGGELSRITIERSSQIGSFNAFKPLMPVTQFVASKPS